MKPEYPPHADLAKTGKPASKPEFAETALVRPDTSVEAPKAAATGATAQSWVGKSLGKYLVSRVLGQGGMGVVLQGYDPMIERDVAIKVLADHMAADALALGRFLSEAKSAGKLNHPNVIAIYEIRQEEQTHYLVMEFVPGGSLGDGLARDEPLPLLDATRAMIDACKGVGAAHAAGMVHRDIKPANFMRAAADGSIKVADFGLAKAASGSNRHFTQTGIVVGTPFFMSPEQCEAKPVDRRGDIYSLGATYYSLLTGHHPYQESDSVPQLMYLHCHGPIPDPRSINPAIPTACSRIIARAMAKAPDERYQSTDEMLADLQTMLATFSGETSIVLPSDSGKQPSAAGNSHGTKAKSSGGLGVKSLDPSARRLRPGLLIGGLAALALLVVLGVVFWPRDSSNPDADKGGESGVSGAAVQGVSATEIVLGMSAPFSGQAAELGREMEIGIRTFLEHVNDEGGIAGRKLRLVALDDGYEPALFWRVHGSAAIAQGSSRSLRVQLPRQL